MTAMHAAVWTGPGQIEPVDLPLPEIPEGWALLRVARVGLCGTDFGIFHGQHPRAIPPLIMGHEFCGEIVSAPSGAAQPGELVAVEPLISCGQCWACQHQSAHVCANLGLYGIDQPGALATHVAVPAATLHQMPAGVRLELAALVEPLAVAVHAVATSGLRPADTVAVFGGGPVGVLTALVAQYHGAQRIIMNEPNPVRAQVAARLGLDVVLTGEQLLQSTNEATAGEGADVVFDCAGHATVAPYLTEAARPTATLVIVGVHKQPVPLDLRRVNFAEQRIQGVRVYTHADFETAVNLAAADTLGLARLPIRTFPLARVSEAFQAAMQPGEYLKVMVQP